MEQNKLEIMTKSGRKLKGRVYATLLKGTEIGKEAITDEESAINYFRSGSYEELIVENERGTEIIQREYVESIWINKKR